MDRPRHPNVIRTWTVERTRHPVRNIAPPKPENVRSAPVKGVPSSTHKPPAKQRPESQ